MIDTVPLFQVLLHKITIPEWELEKDNILSLIPFGDEKYRTAKFYYTYYFDKNEKLYANVFLDLIRPYLDEFLKTSEYKFTKVDEIWCQRYKKHNFHTPHDHGPRGYACVFYAEMDPEVHGSTEFLSPSPNVDGGKGVKSIRVMEGDLVLFPCNLFHQSPPHLSEKNRTIIAFNLF